ncbi:acetyl-CoA synthetase-like protein [Thelephora ganbajun]|uniref:Acetyl-CoA synthetase-like protein n=1 Tax=Thelephora ganbajun TaxID=370292 RepID=A0ACB6ZG32_THEGA|nr:acetyl-CoA synthetase-like protein [Thelephora ganbajun]
MPVPLLDGVSCVLMHKFNILEFFRYIQDDHIGYAWAIPPIASGLLNRPGAKDYDLTSLRTLVVSTSPLANPVNLGLHEKFMSVKPQLWVTRAYGMTELSGAILWVALPESLENDASTDRLFPGVEARIVDEGSKDRPSLGSTGDLRSVGGIVTRESKGFFVVVDRKKELIKYKGFQVPPAELEGVFLGYPDIADVDMIGVVVDRLEFPRFVLLTRSEWLTVGG